jgi:hypothetical protein
MARRERGPLRLLAQDADDLRVISAALQDAVLKVGDLSFEPRARRFTVALNRFQWEMSDRRRIRAALQFGGVLEAKSRRVRRDASDAVLSLLAVTFEGSGEAEDPSGVVTLAFSGDADVRLRVEALDAVLADVSAPWPARGAPRHDLSAG